METQDRDGEQILLRFPAAVGEFPQQKLVVKSGQGYVRLFFFFFFDIDVDFGLSVLRSLWLFSHSILTIYLCILSMNFVLYIYIFHL